MRTDDPTCVTHTFLLLRAFPDPASTGEENGVSITSLPKKEVSPWLEHRATRSKVLVHGYHMDGLTWAHLILTVRVGKGEFDPSIPLKKKEISRQCLD